MGYRDEQNRIFDEIELKRRLQERLTQRDELTREFEQLGLVFDEKMLAEMKRVGTAAGFDEENFIERVMRAAIDANKKASDR